MPRTTSSPLHFAASLRVVAKHRQIAKISIIQARKAVDVKPLEQDQLMVEELECVTGMRIAGIASLAALTIEWLPR
jgi:hypothetical protein